jgi:hypothetical protein
VRRKAIRAGIVLAALAAGAALWIFWPVGRAKLVTVRTFEHSGPSDFTAGRKWCTRES